MDYKSLNNEKICQIAIQAGLITLQYHKKITNYDKKSDGSELTVADQEANEFIIKNLQKEFPEIAIVSEEKGDLENLEAAKNHVYFLIDPLDGTKNFINGGDNYTVNIALIINQKAVLGFIYCPALDILYYTKNDKSFKRIDASKNGKGAEIKCSDNKDNITLITTKREPEKSDIVNWSKNKGFEIAEIKHISSSYKFCLIAEGEADLYPRLINIKTWDIAAGEAIIRNSGGKMLNFDDFSEIIYKNDFLAPKFIAFNNEIDLNKRI